ncbi:MAG: ferritin family protein [Deltaproteobacteria bacterium]|nr:ferritin family protein [Deltaproteobacteria bacterium]
MDDAMKKVVEALRKAIQAEIEGQHFYRMASRSTDDPRGREVFEQLAQDEVDHEKFLRAHYDHIIEKGTPSPDAKLGTPKTLPESSPIFSDAIKSRIEHAHYEMTALSVGIQLELSAVKFYKQAAGQTADPLLKQQFRDLSEWESGHYQALLRQQEELKEDYWASSNFAPY